MSCYIGDPDAEITESPSTQASTPAITAVSLKLPEFWPSDPELCFAQAEALFSAQNISSETTRFGHVVRVLPAQYALEVRDIILSPPENPHTAIKEALKKRLCPTQRQQLQQLLHLEDRQEAISTPSLHVETARGKNHGGQCQPIFKQLFLDMLPLSIRTALAMHHDRSLQNLAEMADAMAEIQAPHSEGLGRVNVCAVKTAENNSGLAEIRKELDNIWRELKAQ